MKKLVSMLLIAVFLASLIAIPNAVSSTTPSRPTLGYDEPEPIYDIPGLEGKIVEDAQPDTGNPWTVIAFDDYYGGFYYQDFECVLNGTQCNIWIGLSPDIWAGGYHDEYDLMGAGFDDDTWYFAYPWTATGWYPSGRSFLPGYRDFITGKQLVEVRDEFDNWIHDKDTSFFGDYDHSRIGPFGDGKIQVLIFNIRDEFFYSPDTAPGFIMGYFWSFASDLNNANIIHIDTWQWYRRQGPSPTGYHPLVNPPYSPAQCLPYQYEATFAHEFQHLIHHDNDPDELSWVNEGCSTLAEFICGYGATTNLFYYIAYFWDTSLVIWHGNLEDYGVVFLWTLYMYEHYGGQQLIWDIVHEQANGIEGWNNVLEAHHIRKDFDDIFQDWAIANYLDDTSFARGIYGYYGLDLPCAASGWWDIPYSIFYWNYYYPWFDIYVDTYPNVGYNYPYGYQLPYVVNYVEFYDGLGKIDFIKLCFDGDDYCGVPAYSGMYEWYSDGTAWSWYRLGQTFDLTSVTEATLRFWTYYEIEADWDYGYVEVHDLDTDEWYTLEGLTTISYVDVPQDNPYCPDDVEPWAYEAAGRWNAFTGYSPGYYQEVMDLTPFAGHAIELYFTYWTDGYTQELGWYIDDIEIPEIGFFDDVESGPGDWTVNYAWYITTGVIPNNFEVNIIQSLTIHARKLDMTLYFTCHVCINDETEEGCIVLPRVNTKCATSGPAVMVAANQPGYEHTFGTYYEFEADVLHFPWH
jgi:hypothetical protein